MNLNELSLSDLKDRLDRGEVGPVEVLRDHLDAIDRWNGGLNAFLYVFRDRAERRARELEKEDLSALPLGGVPIAVKDNICVEGEPTTCGSAMLRDYRPPYDAGAVERLERAGAVILGKTNLDEFAMGSSNEHSAFGAVRNPWDPERAPGGSSGGSAVAVAARLAPGALGSDTGGSIRQPAAFTGVVGVKPTYGRVSRYGLVAFASSLDQIGCFGRDVRDAAMLLGPICAHDPRDSTSSERDSPQLLEELDRGLTGLRLGAPAGILEGLDAEVRAVLERALAAARGEGAQVVEIELPHAAYAIAAYYVVANAEASSNLARFDGVRYGHRAPDPENLVSMLRRTREEGFGSEVKRRILLGTFVLSSGYYDAYYLRAQKARTLVLRDFEAAFERCDLVLLPTAPTPAFRLGEKIDDPLQMYLTDVFTAPGSLAGLPGISVPGGLHGGRLPLGVQLLGRPFDEATLFRGARGLERALGLDARPDLEAAWSESERGGGGESR
jgi:aspartyl-tRNA(Asn)/glutamyl-tRNA(Gln) amidotransferase subunit A